MTIFCPECEILRRQLAEAHAALWEFAENLRLMRQYDSLSQQNQNSCIVDGYALWEKWGHLLTPLTSGAQRS